MSRGAFKAMDQTSRALSSYSNINVVGTSGSGKSTFARKLAAALNSPYIEMDKIFWGANWTSPSDEEFFGRLRPALAGPRWVLDGNYNRTLSIKWENVDLVIWLDYSFPRTLFQAIRRAATRAWNQQELWEGTGNRESFQKSFFSREPIIWWTVKTHGKFRKRYADFILDKKYAHVQFVRLKNHAEARKLLRTLASTAEGSASTGVHSEF